MATKYFDFVVRDIIKSSPTICRETSPVIVVTQLCSMDVHMYLVAIKTFTRYVAPKSVHVISDGLSSGDERLLERQVRGIHIQDIREIEVGEFPRGGTWERLLYILDVSRDAYAVQLDADTVTLALPGEVLECIGQNQSFTLGSYKGQQVTTFRKASEDVKKGSNSASDHVQILAELAMERFDDCDRYKYVRGNSAFAGFAKGQHSRDTVRYFSQTMEALIGKQKWNEWGSEQVTSNYAVANSANPRVLPFPKYRYFKPGSDTDDSTLAFLHFMGTHRFSEGKYRAIARQHISTL